MENKNSLELIIAWIKAHPLFKWSAMCANVGIDKANFQKIMLSDTPKVNPELIPKMIAELKKYGYVDGAAGVPLPADYVETQDVAILHTNGNVDEVVELKVGDKKAWNKALKEAKTYGKKKKVKTSVKDLNKQTGRKVITDPPAKSNVTINTMPVKKKGEDVFDFAARKNEWKRKNNK